MCVLLILISLISYYTDEKTSTNPEPQTNNKTEPQTTLEHRTNQPEIGPNIGQGQVPKVSPINAAQNKNINIYISNNEITLDGDIKVNEWSDADTIWWMLGDNVNTTGYFMRNSSHLLVALYIPDATPEDREKARFVIDVNGNGGGVNQLKDDDIQFYLQRGENMPNNNPSSRFDNHAWDIYYGNGVDWIPYDRTKPFDFGIINNPTYWSIEMALPLEYFKYNGEETKEYKGMIFVANAGRQQGSWPLNTYIGEPNSWGKLIIHNSEN